MDEAMRFLTVALGLDPPNVVELPEFGMTTAFFRCGDADIELIGMSDSDARRRRIGAGRARIEHVAIRVDDLEETSAALRADGVSLTGIPSVEIEHPLPFRVGSRLNVWTDPDTTGGIIYQFIEDVSADPQ